MLHKRPISDVCVACFAPGAVQRCGCCFLIYCDECVTSQQEAQNPCSRCGILLSPISNEAIVRLQSAYVWAYVATQLVMLDFNDRGGALKCLGNVLGSLTPTLVGTHQDDARRMLLGGPNSGANPIVGALCGSIALEPTWIEPTWLRS